MTPLACQLLVLAKEPVPGRVKTRLTPPLTPEQGARVAAAALQDTLAAVAATPVARRVLVLDGAVSFPVPDAFAVLPQQAGGLDARLTGAFADAAAGCDLPLLLVGMDTPQVTPSLLTDAVRALLAHGSVLGLADDGGWWACGLSTPHPRAFLGVPMSEPTTGAAQAARLSSLGLAPHALPVLRDVDTAADLHEVRGALPADSALARLDLPGLLVGADGVTTPVDVYGRALHGLPVQVRYADGLTLPLDAPRWVRAELPGDDELLSRCGSATLDVGCGPGRLARALLGGGVACTGVDVAPAAVELARARGAEVLHASVHDAVLDGTRWSTVLLADGNIGIGGDPVGLLRRASALLSGTGRVVVEVDPPATSTRRVRVRLEAGEATSSWFPWAHVAADDVPGVAAAAGLQSVEAWSAHGRHFAVLAPAGLRTAA